MRVGDHDARRLHRGSQSIYKIGRKVAGNVLGGGGTARLADSAGRAAVGGRALLVVGPAYPTVPELQRAQTPNIPARADNPHHTTLARRVLHSLEVIRRYAGGDVVRVAP